MGTDFEREWDAYGRCSDKLKYYKAIVDRELSLMASIGKMENELAVVQEVIKKIEKENPTFE